MDIYSSTLLFVTEILFLIFCYTRTLIYLRFFQQEEYDAKRFLNWIWSFKAFDKRGLLVLAVSLGIFFLTKSQVPALIPSLIVFAVFVFQQSDPRKTGKIKLNMTARANRIFSIALVLNVIFYLALSLPCISCHGETENYLQKILIFNILILQFLPFSLIFANLLLSPFEKYTKLKYKNEAKAILKKMNPYVIGITGSYGKTSVKSALGEVMNNALAPTFCPPKSINTEMGITREIRENLKPNQKYAVIEMGAYNVGSIKRLCNLTPPQAGLVTVVGMAHLERYGTLERIYQAKSELAQALPQDGILVCNGDNEGARKMASEYPKKITLLYGMKPELGKLDCIASNVSFSLEGTNFDLLWKDKKYSASTKLLGLPALSNLLGVFTMACTLGADPEFVLATIRNIKPVDNRLSLSREGQVYFLRDAYNSNPLGFEAALDVLAQLPAARKILMTPGMVELGSMQYEENKKAAFQAAKCCDFVILVGETNRKALKDGLESGGFKAENLIICDTRTEAFTKLNTLMQNGDIVLIENDLTDLYEMTDRF